MPHFIVEYRELRSADARQAHRGEHIAYRKSFGAAMPLAGPIMDDVGNPIGSVIILQAKNKAEAKRLSLKDPFVQHGVFDLVSVRNFRIASLGRTAAD